ncbi:MAG TPA: Crp/Fnr family transcriptional regulator [Terriglobales bacterium]|nr:Crp/Fnr family transcriptional regulator [Terriglobales bacterium]
MAVSDVSTVDKPLPEIPTTPVPRTDRDGRAIQNRILLTIPEDEFMVLRPLMEEMDMPQYKIFYEQGDKIEYAYFPNEGMVSLVVLVHDGRSVEVGITGNEGVVGAPLAFGFESAPMRAIMQLPGKGLRIKSAALEETFGKTPNLRFLIEQYVMTQQLQVAQLAACNRLHDMDQRLARWLLMCQDRIDSENLPLTHEFIAQMLGSGRPTVTIAAGALERAGLIANTRGSVKILNRKRLEDAACECYRVIQTYNGSLVVK